MSVEETREPGSQLSLRLGHHSQAGRRSVRNLPKSKIQILTAHVLFCFVLFCYMWDRQPARMATWPMSQAPEARSRPSPRTWYGRYTGPLCVGYSQFGFRRLLPARTAQSAPFRWPAVDRCALQALPGSPRGRTGTARALPVPARRDPAPVAGPPVTAVGMHTLLCPSAGSSPGLPHW